MTQSKKMLSVLLSLVLALAMVPSIAFAAEGEEPAANPAVDQPAVQEEATVPESAEPEIVQPEADQSEQAVEPEESAEQAVEPQEQKATAPAAKKAENPKAAKSAANARSTYNVRNFKITMNDGMIYTGGYLKPAVTIVDPDGIKLVKGVDYTVSYSNNKKKGKGTATIKLIGNYVGTAKVTFVIGGWKQFSGKWCFGYQVGNTFYCFKKQFATINGKTYRFNSNGYRLTGWQSINGYRYRFNTKGVMQKGLITVNGSKYYMNPDNGRLRTGWWTVNGKLRYFRPGTNPKGKMYAVTKNGAVTINGYRYYFIDNGANDYAVKNAWYGGYYYGSNGRWNIVKPNVYAELDSDYFDTGTNGVAFYMEHLSNGGVLTIQSTGHKLNGASMVLTDITSDGYFSDLSYHQFPANTYDTVILRTSNYDTLNFDENSTITFKFKYDGVMWIGTVNSYGFSCVRA